jgi:ATP phosphoribosyltransferase regulatory subunit
MSLVSHMSYYTGVLFEVYAENVGFLLGNGGRYDELLAKFHRPSPATGFSVRLDRLMEAVGEQQRREKTTCIIFSQERFAEAYVKAEEMRRKGEKVVLQQVAGIQDMDQFTASFDEVEYVIGKLGKDEQSC